MIKNFVKFKNLENKKKFNSTIWINILQLEEGLNILGAEMIAKK